MSTPPRRARARTKAQPPLRGGIVDRLQRRIALVQRDLLELDENGGASPQQRAQLLSRLFALRSQVADARGQTLESERASAEALRWEAEARLPGEAMVCPACAAAEIAARDAAKFLREARETFLTAGYPPDAVDAVMAGPPLLVQAEAAFTAEGDAA